MKIIFKELSKTLNYFFEHQAVIRLILFIHENHIQLMTERPLNIEHNLYLIFLILDFSIDGQPGKKQKKSKL